MAMILLDCDGVLLEWDRSFASWCRKNIGATPCPSGPKDWNLAEWLGCDDAEALSLVAEFNASPEFGNIWPCINAVQGVSRLAFDGHEMHVITSCSEDPEAARRRHENLVRCFGDVFSAVYCLPLGASKAKLLGQFERGCIWVEDNYCHAVAGREAGHHTFMIERSHNRTLRAGADPMIRWVTTWDDIVSLAHRITF